MGPGPDSPVYWPHFGRTFKKMSRFRAHDETESLVRPGPSVDTSPAGLP